jgi:hypothetical protein
LLATPDARAVVYGKDDRHEIYAEPNQALRDRSRATAVALIPPERLLFSSTSDAVVPRAAPLAAWDDYCDGTPFLAEPTAATCSGVLIDDDLVLTAGHCFDQVQSCRDYDYVFDYLYAAPGALGPIARDAVFGCRVIAVREQSAPDSVEQVDLAIVQLDRSAAPRAPAAFATGSLVAGDALTVVGFPSGLPTKIDSGTHVVDARAAGGDFFTLTSDTFRGSSGSGVYGVDGALAGVFARGTSDFVDEGGCRSLRVLPQNPPSSGESATYAARALAALCQAGWPSARLCGVAPSCGDGVCSSAGASPESSEDCPADCAPPTCGDGLCEQSERDSCPADCGDRRPNGLPEGWYCEPVWYRDGVHCDCDCGAPDPDCGDPHAPRACDAVGPAGRTPAPADLNAAGGCSVLVGAAQGGQGKRVFAVLAVAIIATRGRRRSISSRTVSGSDSGSDLLTRRGSRRKRRTGSCSGPPSGRTPSTR